MHYNKERNRKNDHMLPVRNFHNFVKTRLIASVCSNDAIRYLDLCCGSGGDIGKLKFHNIKEYFGIDLATEAVNRALQRLKKETEFHGDVICLNAFSVTCGAMLSNMRAFDIVSCQFALHYSFRDETTARIFVENVSTALTTGGYFIGTIPDSEYILNARRHLGKWFGDRYHSIKFAHTDFSQEYGDAYEFSFYGAVESLTEYVVRRQTLVDLCKELGLELVEWRNFTTYNDTDRLNHSLLFEKMGAQFTSVSKIYATFCFKKI